MGWASYDHARAAAYDAERAVPDAHLAEVRDILARRLSATPPTPVIDVGAGTGLWSDRLARWFGMPVIAVEPSTAMITRLAAKRLADVVAVQARGEALPVRDHACGAAWLSTVVHHFADLRQAVAETGRVVTPDGVVLVRSSFPDQPSRRVYPVKFFPSAARVAARFPTLGETVGAFDDAGFRLHGRHAPREVASPTRRDFLERVKTRADSLLREATDEEFAAGLSAVRRWVAAAPEDPVLFRPDLLVFRRTAADA